jgi:hypothetical protein
VPDRDTEVKLEVLSVKNAEGEITTGMYDSYIDLGQKVIPYTDQGSQFLLSSKGNLATITLQATLGTRLPDGTITEVKSDIFSIRVTDEYIDLTPVLEGVPVATITTTDT